VDARLAFALELEQRDEAVAQRLAALASLGDAVGALRTRADAILAFRAALPAERAHLDDAGAEATRALELARDQLAAARAAVERARRDDAREAARADEARAAAAVRSAEERVERTEARRAALEREAEELAAEAGELERRAGELAERLAELPRVSDTPPPERGLEHAVDWAARAQAALLVARGGLESERERIVREANELASSVLAEPLHSTSVALVRRELEERLA
jgi:chromosome segregation ATPase